MAQVPYRANLSASIFPMTISRGGRTVIVPGADQNFDRRVDPTGEQKDAGIPQVLYLENVIPTVNGYRSVNFKTATGITKPPGVLFIRNAVEIYALNTLTDTLTKVPLIQFNNGVLISGRRSEVAVTVVGTLPATSLTITSAVVKNICYVYFPGFSSGNEGLYTATFDGTTLTLTDITATVTPLNFFTTEGIVAICGANNYLVALNTVNCYHSSTTTATDFVPSLVTGAGQAAVDNTQGAITYARQSYFGFYVYTESNVLAVQYTGNARYPWKFIPVAGVGSVKSPQVQSFGDATTKYHYIIENDNYIKILQGTSAEVAAPEFCNFLAQGETLYDRFNYSTNVFTQVPRLSQTSLYVVADRYILISYDSDENGYQAIMYFDVALQRYGRLKLFHTYIFGISTPPATADSYKDAILLTDSSYNNYNVIDLSQLDSTLASTTEQPYQGVFLLGKLQLVRSKLLKLEEVIIEGAPDTVLDPGQTFAVYNIPSLDGRNFGAAEAMYLAARTGDLAEYRTHRTATNHSILIKGKFSINTIAVKVVPAGDR